ncbi:3-methyladenine DNA glycosylase [Kitasatospora nipponensis]|uniref:3-methyladenine DNA glycosylase n=1 Tax=Kitasatospora nipponensis TaxID=258049 RepID=A0ABN1WAI7_9ACTN
MDTARHRRWRPDFPLDLARVLLPLRHGPRDPAFHTTPDGSFWRASRTPAGIGTLRITAAGTEIDATAWGPGADWLLERLPLLLGAGDDPTARVLQHPALREVQRRHPGLRQGASGLVLESLIPAVIEQKVTVLEAHRSWRYLLTRFGTPAPGPLPELRAVPSAREWALIPSWEWHRAGVDPKRADTVQRAVRLAPRLEEASAMGHDAAVTRLTLLPGIGPWTAAETLQRCNGDPDAVSVGDYHLANHVGWALAGRPRSTDEQMLELLAPYTGQRHRVCRLIALTGTRAPRFGPRLTPEDHRVR